MPQPDIPAQDLTLDHLVARVEQRLALLHRGVANGVPAEDIARQLGVSPRRLRAAISAARERGAAICGHPATGYYLAATPEELRAAAAFLEQRAMHSLRLLARMRRVSLPELLGQMALPS